MALTSFAFPAAFARRIPDPNFSEQYGLQRHLFVMRVKDIPAGLPLDPNARRPKTSKRVYEKVRESLLNQNCEHGTFHLKNKGITCIAQSVKPTGKDLYEITMSSVSNHGIVDGGHTYALIQENQENLPDDQYVNVEVRVGIPEAWITDIAGGLNTSVQVQDMSLDDLGGLFDWVKEALKNEKYFSAIAWSENDPGEFDARDIVALMTMFNIELFPNDGDEHPIYAYEKKSTALKEFENKGDSYRRMLPILKDILRLHDIIRLEFRDIWNKATKGKAAALSFAEKRTKPYDFPFIGKKFETRMMTGALYPILAAFRWYVVEDQMTLKMVWRDGFDEVYKAWKRDAHALIKATVEQAKDEAYNIQSLGKRRPHWTQLHNLVAKKDLEARMAIAE